MTSGTYTIDEQGKLKNFAIKPQVYVDETVQAGFTKYAETINGRLAMIGFVSLLAFAALTGQGLVQ